MKKRGLVVYALASLVAAAFASTAGAGSSTATQAQALNCKRTLKIGMITPVTGGGGFIGTKQVAWAKYAVKTLAPKYGLKIKFLVGDSPVEQGVAPAQALAQKYVSDPTFVGMVGPATSSTAAGTAQTFFDAGVAAVSPSATNTALTKGPNRTGTPGFFRVVPDDGIQGPSDARFMVDKLKAKKVFILDFQEAYSVGLSDQVETYLKKQGVDTTRVSVSNKTSDYSSIVTKVANDTDIVFFPAQQPEDAQTMARQLAEQGKKAKVFGGDGTNGPGKFTAAGSYVSNFAAPIDLFAYNKAIIAGWKKDNPGQDLESFGPPAYGAVQVLLNSIKKSCDAGKGTMKDRRDVIRNMKKTPIKNWILGGNFRFSTKTNDPLNGQFYIFQIQADGSYKLIS